MTSTTGSTAPSVWEAATTWICRHGGYVNPHLCYSESRRQVSLKDIQANDIGAAQTKNGIDEGEVLLQIPDECLLSLHSIEETAFGKSLFAAVHALLLKQDDVSDSSPSASKRAKTSEFVKEHNVKRCLYNDEQDVIIALFLAYLMERKELQSNSEHCTDDSKPWVFFRPYLDTLPTNTSNDSDTITNEYLDLLPRQWPIETIEKRLKGTSLYNRVLAEKKGLVDEYNAIKSAWERSNAYDSFPSLEYYDMMMAAVSSRGFAGLGREGVDVMIPMLDLLNHARVGAGESEGDIAAASDDETMRDCKTADVRYSRYSIECETTTEDKTDGNTLKQKDQTAEKPVARGGIKVISARHLQPGSELLMTYGAKGNASLLGRYGFCIENNVEPDGSCNDILEIQLLPGSKPVRLQSGPKSYSYLPFVEALNVFNKTTMAQSGEINACAGHIGDETCSDQEEDDLDAFLNVCDNESDEDDEVEDEAVDCYTSLAKGPILGSGADEARMKCDMSAVTSLITALEHAKSELVANELMCNCSRTTSTQEQYCLILIRSEIQTLSFFLAISNVVKQHLDKMSDVSAATASNSKSASEHVGRIRDFETDIVSPKYIVEVVNAFLAIRY